MKSLLERCVDYMLGATGTRSLLDGGGGLASQVFAVCFGTVKADMLNK